MAALRDCETGLKLPGSSLPADARLALFALAKWLEGLELMRDRDILRILQSVVIGNKDNERLRLGTQMGTLLPHVIRRLGLLLTQPRNVPICFVRARGLRSGGRGGRRHR